MMIEIKIVSRGRVWINFHGKEKIAEGELTTKPAFHVNLHYFKEWDVPKGQKITEEEVEELKRFAKKDAEKKGFNIVLIFE
jgi:hypothetical protein